MMFLLVKYGEISTEEHHSSLFLYLPSVTESLK